MGVLSKIQAASAVLRLAPKAVYQTSVRNSARVIPRMQGEYLNFLFRDVTHFYLLVGLVPPLLFIAYVHCMYGPCELRDIPEGYEPHYWEYERLPITQWIAKYWYGNYQKKYELVLAQIHEEDQKMKWRHMEQRVKHLLYERGDYKAYYHIPSTTRWLQYSRFTHQRAMENNQGIVHEITG